MRANCIEFKPRMHDNNRFNKLFIVNCFLYHRYGVGEAKYAVNVRRKHTKKAVWPTLCFIPQLLFQYYFNSKPPTDPISYRTVSLLHLMSRIFERFLLVRIKNVVPLENPIPEHLFGFREKHSAVQQCHQIANKIKGSLEEKKMCLLNIR